MPTDRGGWAIWQRKGGVSPVTWALLLSAPIQPVASLPVLCARGEDHGMSSVAGGQPGPQSGSVGGERLALEGCPRSSQPW